MELGMSGIGLYWCIIECLYENNGYLDLDQIDLLAYELRIDKETINKLIDEYDLFKKNKKSFYSKSVLQRLDKINELSKKNKENAQKRWAKAKENPNTDSNATALRPQSNIKENKIKEKENKIKENNINTTTNIYDYIENNFGRLITPIEYEKINTWLSSYKQEIIEHAIEIAVMNRKRNFNYVEGILKNWKSKDLESIKDIYDEELKIDALKHQREDDQERIELYDYDWLNDPENENE